MSAVLMPADPGDAWADLCAGAPTYLIAPDDAAAARSLAGDYIRTLKPHLRGCLVETLAPVHCYELRWSDMGEDEGDVGRLSAYALPWRTAAELLKAIGTPQDECYVQVLINGEWAQMRVDPVNELEAA